MKTDTAIKRDIVSVCRRLDDLGFVPATDGNVSARARGGRLWITPSLAAKGTIKADQLLLVDERGRVLSGKGRPSSEMKMHLEVYRQRPDVGAVVHAHPPAATAFAACGQGLAQPILPEAVVLLGPVPLAPYATPSTEEVPKSISSLVKKHQAVLLANHGALTYGKDLREALERMERLEHLARVLLLAKLIGGRRLLGTKDLAALRKLFSDA